jgi:hypothetical protein
VGDRAQEGHVTKHEIKGTTWAKIAGWDRPDSFRTLLRFAADPAAVFQIKNDRGVWVIVGPDGKTVMDYKPDFEQARRQCQRMGWKYL